jgi:NADPH-dependent F420 reductase
MGHLDSGGGKNPDKTLKDQSSVIREKASTSRTQKQEMLPLPVVASVGGTGNLGSALARRLARGGHRVIIGSRDAIRAQETARRLSAGLTNPLVGAGNSDAARDAEIIIVTVPFASQRQVLIEIREQAQNKIVVVTTVPLVPPEVMRVQLPFEGSAAQIAQQTLGSEVTLISAFHNVPAQVLASDDPSDHDVLVFGDLEHARERVVELARTCGLRGIHAGPLANSAASEALTSVLIFINLYYGVHGAGIRITGPSLWK